MTQRILSRRLSAWQDGVEEEVFSLSSRSITVLFPTKTTPLVRKSDCTAMGPHDSKTACGSADHRDVEGRLDRDQCPDPLQEAQDLRCHLLYVAEGIRLPGAQRCEEVAPVGRAESAVNADGEGAGTPHLGAQGVGTAKSW